MNELTAPVIRFRHAAAAAGVTKKTLRNWLARDLVFSGPYRKQEGESLRPETRFVAPAHEPRKWQEFDLQELAVLAITAEIAGYGIGITPAFSAAYNAVGSATSLLAQYNNFPRAALPAAFVGHQIFIHSRDGKTRIQLVKPNTKPDPDFLLTSFLVINLHGVINRMNERLSAALDTDDDD